MLRSKRSAYGRLLISTLEKIKYGELSLTTPEGEKLVFKGKEAGPKAYIKINDWLLVKKLIARGDVGFAEGYVEGVWETDELPTLLTLCTMNINELDKFFHGHWWSRIIFSFINYLRRNTKGGSKKNIRAHYDLGNNFYQLWLDKSMTYSSAYFVEGEKETLEEAQAAKYQMILDKLHGKAGDRILEIGCGWGGFAEYAASKGYYVTGLTISEEQGKFARERIAKAGFDKQVEIKLMDYRDAKSVYENNKYDFVVSIEMFEAVGEKYWPVYFNTIQKILKPEGKAVIQTITIQDEIFEDYKKRSDFIQQYTFPGGVLPSQKKFIEAAENARLKAKTVFAFGYDYVKTLQEWLRNFDKQKTSVSNLGFNEEFIKEWRFYLSFCIAGFATTRTNVVQIELVNV